MNATTNHDNLAADLRARWVPTADQVANADNYLAAHPEVEYVYSIHLLVNKTFGFWTTDVEVRPTDFRPDEIFVDRVEAWKVLAARAEAYAKAHDIRRLTGGYTIHTRDGWAVFEDIGTTIGDA